MARDQAHGARTDDSRRPQDIAWQTSAPGDAHFQGRTPSPATDRTRRKPRVTAS